MLISPIRFDSGLQNCYNSDTVSGVVYKRITEKASCPRQQKEKIEAFSGKRNVPTKVIYR